MTSSPSTATLANVLIEVARTWPRSGMRYLSDDLSNVTDQTYASLLDQARRILGGLRERKLAPQDKVALLLERPQDVIPVLWACVLGGYVPCPLTALRADRDRWAAQLAHVHTLLEDPLVVTTEGLQAEMPEVPGLIVERLETLAAPAPDLTMHQADPDDVAMLVLTSGSTGVAKAVMLTHRNLTTAMPAKARRQRLVADDITLNWIAFDHVAALLKGHLLPLTVGATQVHVMPQTVLSDPLQFLRLIDSERVTVAFTPNFLMGQINRRLTQHPEDLSVDLSSIRHIISGGEAVACATASAFLKLLAPYGLRDGAVWPTFGMTETCAGSIYSDEFISGDTGQEFASVGTPMAGLRMRVVDAADSPLPDGRVGELQLAGEMICPGYFNNPEATQAAFTADGWFRTGDRGRIDQGRLTLVGRSKDSIIVNGVNYFSQDLEATLEQLAGVTKSSVAAFPIRPPESDTEQLVIAFVPAGNLDDTALYQLLLTIRDTTVMRWGFRPSLILPLPASELSKTSLGKIQRSLLRQRLEAGEFAPHVESVARLAERHTGGYVKPEGRTEEVLAEIYASVFEADPASISVTANFFDLGGTSLNILQVIHHLERRLGVRDVGLSTLLRAPTVRDLARWLREADRNTYDPLVPLNRSGAKTPLFCVHAATGEALGYVNLAKYFAHERPIYGLQTRGLVSGEEPFASVDEMVDCYVSAIRRIRPAGPYALAGHSLGGPIAFEIAKILEDAGEQVEFLGVIDMPPHIQPLLDVDPNRHLVNLAVYLSLINKEQSEALSDVLADLPEQRQHQHIMEIASPARVAELDLTLPRFSSWATMSEQLRRLWLAYAPSGKTRRLVVFYADPVYATAEDWRHQLQGWDAFSHETPRYLRVPGNHYTLLEARHVTAFHAILHQELERSGSCSAEPEESNGSADQKLEPVPDE